MDRTTYDPQGKKTDVFKYVDDKVAAIPTPDLSEYIAADPEIPDADDMADGEVRLAFLDAPRLPEGYTEVKYIESNGKQRINTGWVAASDNVKVVAKAQVLVQTTDTGYIFGATSWASPRAYSPVISVTNGSVSGRCGGTEVYAFTRIDTVTSHVFAVELKDGVVRVSMDEITNERAFTGNIATQPMFLFAENYEGTAARFPITARMECAYGYENGALVRDYVPCIDPNGVAGMYDLVTGVFKGSEGAEPFIAGPVVEFAVQEPSIGVFLKKDGRMESIFTSDPSEHIADKDIHLIDPVPIHKGGTGAASAEDARTNLEAEKAGAAQLVFDKIISKKDQLIVNGSASLADNTGISALWFDGSQAYFSRGSFTYDNGKLVYFFCDDFFEIDPRKSYEFSFDLKSKNGVARMYSFLTFFDADHNEIWQQNYYFRTGSTTKLAKDLVAGDTVVYLEDVSGWSKEWQLGTLLTVWNYKNSFGYQYAPETYTRNYYPISRSGQYPTDDAIDHANNTVKLQTAYSGATIPAGTYVSQGYDGNGWGYKPCSNTIAPTEWTHFSAVIDPAYIRPGAIFTRYGFFWNDRSEDDQVWGTNFVLKELSGGVTTEEMNTAISNAVGSINTVLDEINGEVV